MRRARWATALLALVAAIAVASPALSENKKKKISKGDDLAATDNVSVARMLFTDGLYDRAAATLDQIDPAAPGLDLKEFWLLKGLTLLRLERHAEAAQSFGSAIEAAAVPIPKQPPPEPQPKLWLLKAQAHLSAGQAEQSAETFDKAPPSVFTFPEAFILRANVLYRLDRKHDAFSVLEQGQRAFPEKDDIERQRLFLLVELGLFQEALEAARAFFERREPRPEDRIALAEALRKGQQLDRARLVLEEALLRHPYNTDVRTQLALTYLDLGQPGVAAEVLRPIAYDDPERSLHAAELYRKAGRLERATWMNLRVEDQKKKLRQRLSLLLEQEKFEVAAELEPRLARLGLLDEQPIVYAMAYALFQVRSFERAEDLLSSLTDPTLFSQGIAIRKAIEQCREAPSTCN